MELIDAVGLACPMPVVRAKKALEKSDIDAVTIRVDNFIAVQNLEKMAHGLGYEFAHSKVSESEFDAVLTKRGGVDGGSVEVNVVTDFALGSKDEGRGFVVAIGSNEMGRGVGSGIENDSTEFSSNSVELGHALMKSFIYSLTELVSKPTYIVFFNSGAFLTASDSGALGDLRVLENFGTSILTCGACLNYYKLSSPSVGKVTNMIEIATIMSEADRLINL